ncbi:MAG: OmpA family protein [Desulfobacterales bacterium]|nr:OmpA family protein [Desulfobacterales bacterium]MDD4071486.1 OmpA family protein [Desulfobacterales bacterium]MDD4392926.1 OmpA family protein [Desulfobacterales bacterium]
MKKTNMLLIFYLVFAVSVLTAWSALAAEVLLKDVIERQIEVESVFEKTADNFIVLFDASGSMAEPYKDTGTPKIDLAKKFLDESHDMIPELGYNAGLYLFTPWKSYYEMQQHDKSRYHDAVMQLPTVETAGDFANQPSPLGLGIQNLDPVLAGVTGKTVVFVFTDGSFYFRPRIYPWDAAKTLAQKYNVCFYVISSAQTEKELNTVQKIAAVNECSRVVPFETFIEQPDYYLGALFVVKTNEITKEIVKQKVAGFDIQDIRFDFDKVDVRPEYNDDLAALAKFLKSHPGATALLQGFTDSMGEEEYNLHLARQRVESVGNYLVEHFNVEMNRLLLQWFGKANPIESNDTPQGRAMNRRVEIDITDL